MLIAIALTAATIAGASGGARVVAQDPPPMVITVHAAPTISAHVITFMLREADEIWRRAGVTFAWQVAPLPTAPYLRAITLAPYRPSTLRVIVDDEVGRTVESGVPIGWVVFDDERTPEPDVHVSRANALRLLGLASPLVGRVDDMPRLQQEMLLGRAMGRALAHELGHYLLSSKAHAARGVMQGTLSAWEFFSAERPQLALSPDERSVARQASVGLRQSAVASRQSPVALSFAGRPRS